jgi:hypothetical protein
MTQTLAAIVLIGVFGGICWSLIRPRAVFVIRLSCGAVQFKGDFPRSRHSEVEEFLKREFADQSPITISGVKTQERRLRIIVRGPIDAGDCQRIRNFFQVVR